MARPDLPRRLVLLLLNSIALAATSSGPTPTTFALNERFGVSHPLQPVEFPHPTGGRLDPHHTRLLGADGAETPYQQLSSGNVLIHTGLPASRISTVFSAHVVPGSDLVQIHLSMLAGAFPRTGDVVRFEGPNVPAGAVESANYFVRKPSSDDPGAAFQLSTRKDLSDTVHFKSSPGNVLVRKLGWIVDPSGPSHTLYAKSHSYATGDRIRLRSSGRLPEPLREDQSYFVIRRSGDTFQIALSPADARNARAVELKTPGSGVFETSVEWTWKTASGPTTAMASPVVLKVTSAAYEITNGLTGVRIAKPEANRPRIDLAPIQGIALASGEWLATGPNYLYELHSPKPAASLNSYSLKILESGPLLVKLEANYSVGKSGYFKETISLYAGHKSIVIEDDSTAQLQYFLNLYRPGVLVPDQARFRGHGVTSAECGHTPEGGPALPYTDAVYDLSYRAAKDSGYRCNAGTIKFAPVWYLPNSGRDTGWYWELYDSHATSPSAPLVGFYLGRSSRYLTPIASGPGLYTSATPAAGITMYAGFRGPDGRTTQRMRREWAIYVGAKSELGGVIETQPIGIEANVLAGINLTRLATYVFDYPDPHAKSYPRFTTRLLADRNFLDFVNASAPELRDLSAMWTAGGIEPVVSHLEQFAFHWLNILVNQNGIYDSWWHYYQPGLVWQPLLTRAMAVLNDPAATPAQRARTKAVAALAASIFWDNDYVPWDVDSGESTGNFNQGNQYALYRAQNALVLNTHPLMAQKQAAARRSVEAVYQGYLNPDSGAPRGSTHYHAAALDPALASFLELANSGPGMNQYPLWSGYGRWLLSALTPPEPRFGNPRKMVSLGDGNTEATAMQGMLATLLRQADPALSAGLQWAWNSENTAVAKTYGEFSAPSMLVIDTDAPQHKPELRSEDFSGYWSVLRHGFDTAFETVAWFVNGNFYSDHRHSDSGQVTLYALNAPLAIDWNANLYYPNVGGGLQHNRVIRESEIGRAWNADGLPLGAGASNWGPAQTTHFAAFPNSSRAETSFVAADGAVWTRTVEMVAADQTRPVVYVTDRFDGTAPKILTWNLMAQGTVETPAGPYTPIARLNTGNNSGTANTLPSAGPDHALSEGVQHFRFEGQHWPAHPAGGIDWDLYLIPDGEQQRFYIGSWGHGAHAGREMGEFQRTNGTPFQESQYILRVRGSDSFSTLILPYRKGETPAGRVVTKDACGLRLSEGNRDLCLSSNGYQFSDGVRKILTTFDAAPAQFAGMTLSGGPAELVVTGGEAKVTLTGNPGKRVIMLQADGKAFYCDYRGGGPRTTTFRPTAR